MEGVSSLYYPSFVNGIPSQRNINVIITGTTSGTGYVAAKTMLIKGATVVMLNRDSPRVSLTMERILSEASETAGMLPEDRESLEKRLVNIPCDLQCFKSVRSAAEKVIEMFPEGINILCNNAGVAVHPDIQTVDGYDVQMQTNHLSHFLLTNLLFKSLLLGNERSKVISRVVNHSSTSRLWPPTILQKKYFMKPGGVGRLGGDGDNVLWGGRWHRYHQSKLANSVFTLEIAKRLEAAKLNESIICLVGHPGLTETECLNPDKGASANFMGMKPTLQTAEDGSLAILECMTSPSVANGRFYGPMIAFGPVSERYHGILSKLSSGDMLWEMSEEATDCEWDHLF